jgi:hypothetical protein
MLEIVRLYRQHIIKTLIICILFLDGFVFSSYAEENTINLRLSELKLVYGYDSVWHAIDSFSITANSPSISSKCSLLTSLNYGCNADGVTDGELDTFFSKNIPPDVPFEAIEEWCKAFEYFRLSLKSHDLYEENIFEAIYLSGLTESFNSFIKKDTENTVERRLEGGLTSYEEESILRDTLKTLALMSEKKRIEFFSKFFSILSNLAN